MKSRKWMSILGTHSLTVLATLLIATTSVSANAQLQITRRGISRTWTGANHTSRTNQTLPQPANGSTDIKNHDARYNVIPIGVLPGKTNTFVADVKSVNNLGHLTGYSYVYTGDFNSVFLTGQGFIWRDGQLHALPLLHGWPGAFGFAMNDRDQVIGTANKLDGSGNIVQTAVMWDHGQPVSLGTLQPNANSIPFGINIWGIVVGGSQNPSTDFNTPVVWYGGTIHALPLLPGMDHGFAEQINDLGIIVGRQGPPDGSSQIPCLWYWNGSGYTPVSLGSFGGDFGDASGLNDVGQIVGWSLYAGDLHGPAFVWNAGGLHALPPLPGDTDGAANNINDFGQIVGFSQLFDDSGDLISQHVVLWQAGTVTDLQSLIPAGSPTLGDVANVNDLGQIGVDSGLISDGTIAGYLLVPTH